MYAIDHDKNICYIFISLKILRFKKKMTCYLLGIEQNRSSSAGMQLINIISLIIYITTSVLLLLFCFIYFYLYSFNSNSNSNLFIFSTNTFTFSK